MTDSNYYSIGEVAKLKGMTIKALRYYDKVGLLVPAFINSDNGYRYYSINQLPQLDIIRLSRQSNVSIRELKELFDKADMNFLKEYLNQKKEDILRQIERDKETCSMIDTIQKSIESSEEAYSITGLSVKEFEDRFYIFTPTQDGEFNEIKSYEKLKQELTNLGLQHSFQDGLIFSNEHTGRWEVRDVFQLISREEYSLYKDSSRVSVLPGGKYLTVNGSMENESELFHSLLHYIEENEMKNTTIYMFYLMVDYFNHDSYHFQFQMAIND
ncbi:helix-turn-helix domain-containing protein [Paenibacillus polymyxa]|uniref:MerR family transcriptional regulator n=1 Tax=Paenibacillus polymyxa TaxID=1406 RepID=UPI0025B6AC31|nr:helix-turn-helix domain-containing protein [Paenibacillus polymyxa]MDN4081272.1 helix-turn-helix domain-containing protein [Paenibacillus polymyxa]MDN4106975.1 helix-turn-helix domain-containing protein [Paenibacillus polymyxa]MDN4116939.1 helix-turn-helix domain-containing protein [Paenibacillus polymyxa]